MQALGWFETLKQTRNWLYLGIERYIVKYYTCALKKQCNIPMFFVWHHQPANMCAVGLHPLKKKPDRVCIGSVVFVVSQKLYLHPHVVAGNISNLRPGCMEMRISMDILHTITNSMVVVQAINMGSHRWKSHTTRRAISYHEQTLWYDIQYVIETVHRWEHMCMYI